MLIADQMLYDIECVLVTALVAAYGLKLLLRRLKRSRPDLGIGRPLLVAFGVRVGSAAVLSVTPSAARLRGGDEQTFLQFAGSLAQFPFSSGEWGDRLTSGLHEVALALQLRLLDSPEFALRVAQSAIAVFGLALLATAVHDLAGRRAGVVAAWLLALEPASVFFSGLIHKEAFMLLAEGLVAFGGVGVWTRASLASVAPMAAGSLIALATRPYAGWFLIAASAAITLHASIRASAGLSARGIPLLAGVVLLVAVSAPVVREGSSEQLETLQRSQQASATDESNLRLERVDFSTEWAVVRNFPRRVRDMILRPYPWQVASPSQRLALLGTVFVLVGLGFLVGAVVRGWHGILRRAAPLVYLLGFLLVAYALAAGNAGTGFRYRTHLVSIGICLVVVLREWQRRPAAAAQAEPRPARTLAVAG